MQMTWIVVWIGMIAFASEPVAVHHSVVEVVEWVAPQIEGEAHEGETCLVSLTIDAQGRGSTPLFKRCDPTLRAATRTALNAWRFAPHEVGGSPVAFQTTLPILFGETPDDLPPLAGREPIAAVPPEVTASQPDVEPSETASPLSDAESSKPDLPAPKDDRDLIETLDMAERGVVAARLRRLTDALQREVLVVGETAELLDALVDEEDLPLALKGEPVPHEGWADRVRPIVAMLPDVPCAVYVRLDWSVRVSGDCEPANDPTLSPLEEWAVDDDWAMDDDWAVDEQHAGTAQGVGEEYAGDEFRDRLAGSVGYQPGKPKPGPEKRARDRRIVGYVVISVAGVGAVAGLVVGFASGVAGLGPVSSPFSPLGRAAPPGAPGARPLLRF